MREAEGENLYNLATVTEMWVAEPGLPESKALKAVSLSKLGEWSNTIKSDHIRFMSAFLRLGLATPLVLKEMENRAEEPWGRVCHHSRMEALLLSPGVSCRPDNGMWWPRYPQLPRKTHGLFSSILSYKARKAFWNLFLVAFPKLCSIENRKVSRSPKFREHLGQISRPSFVSERVPRPQTCQQQLISPRGRGPKYSGFLTHFCYTSFLVLFFRTPCRMNIPRNTLREMLPSIL